MKDIVVAGIQGCGKNVQCKELLRKFGNQLKYFEAGNILRSLQSNDNAIGQYIGSVIDTGKYLPDEFLLGVFDLFLLGLDPSQHSLVDGFPRKLGQMHWFIERMQKKGREFVVLLLEIPEDEVVKRLINRRICKSCGTVYNLLFEGDIKHCPGCGWELYQRKDDMKEEYIRSRINEHLTNTLPVIEHFEKMGVLKRINGNQPIDKVFEEVLAAVTTNS